MSEKKKTAIKPIYQDADISLVEYRIDSQDTTDEYRTLILKTKDMNFGFEFVFGKLLHTWQKKEL